MAKKVRKSKEYRKPSQFAQQPVAPMNPAAPRSEAKAQSNAMILISAGLVTSVLLFFYYHVWALGQLADLSGGQPMPDQYVFGFSEEQIQTLRSVMNEDAVAQLNYVHRSVGLFFPLLFGFFSLLTLGQWVRTRSRRWLAWSAPMLFVVVDLWSNQAIDALFVSDLDGAAVQLASVLTILRWALLIISALTIVVVGLRRFIRTFRQKYAEATQR